MIDSFSGQYRFLSNFWTLGFGIQLPDDPTINYLSTEQAYQAAKTLDLQHRRLITALGPGEAKRFGRQVTIRPDWDQVKLEIMEGLLRQKFNGEERVAHYLCNKLDDTGDAELVEGNHWGDTFWGVCRGVGENHLGKLLMKIRAYNRATYGGTP